MKKIILSLILIIIVSNIMVGKELENKLPANFKLFGYDKVKHFSSSLYLTTTSYYFLNNYTDISNIKAKNYSMSFSFSLGILKEISDKYKKKTYFSYRDLIADLGGTLTGILIINTINNG